MSKFLFFSHWVREGKDDLHVEIFLNTAMSNGEYPTDNNRSLEFLLTNRSQIGRVSRSQRLSIDFRGQMSVSSLNRWTRTSEKCAWTSLSMSVPSDRVPLDIIPPSKFHLALNDEDLLEWRNVTKNFLSPWPLPLTCGRRRWSSRWEEPISLHRHVPSAFFVWATDPTVINRINAKNTSQIDRIEHWKYWWKNLRPCRCISRRDSCPTRREMPGIDQIGFSLVCHPFSAWKMSIDGFEDEALTLSSCDAHLKRRSVGKSSRLKIFIPVRRSARRRILAEDLLDNNAMLRNIFESVNVRGEKDHRLNDPIGLDE